MGLLLESVYQCSQGGGVLRVLYPQTLTPGECQEFLTWMERNHVKPLLASGMPAQARVINKHGWVGATHADISLVYASPDVPAGELAVSVFLYYPEWLVWEDSVPTFARLGELVYRFFYGDAGIK
jgi:hypothetical protein